MFIEIQPDTLHTTLFWPRYGSDRITEAGHFAWTIRRMQEAGKTTDAMAWQYKGGLWRKVGCLKEAVQDRKKWRMLVEEKTRNRDRTNVK